MAPPTRLPKHCPGWPVPATFAASGGDCTGAERRPDLAWLPRLRVASLESWSVTRALDPAEGAPPWLLDFRPKYPAERRSLCQEDRLGVPVPPTT